MKNNFIDLKIRNLVFSVEEQITYGIITGLCEDHCDIFLPEVNGSKSVKYDRIFPMKITPRWLRANQFLDPDERDPFKRFQHANLPIIYDSHNKILYIRGKQYPVRVNFVHHFQNVLSDCGIQSSFEEFGTSPQIDTSCPISQLIGGFRREMGSIDADTIDTNMLFGIFNMNSAELLPGGAGNRATTERSIKTRKRNIAVAIIRLIQNYIPEELSGLTKHTIVCVSEHCISILDSRSGNPNQNSRVILIRVAQSTWINEVVDLLRSYYLEHLHRNLILITNSDEELAGTIGSFTHVLDIDADLTIRPLRRGTSTYPTKLNVPNSEQREGLLGGGSSRIAMKVSSARFGGPDLRVAPAEERELNGVLEADENEDVDVQPEEEAGGQF